MSLFEKLRGTVETIFQFGLGRAQIKSQSTGELEVRNAADGDFAIIRGATPIDNNDLVTKTYADTLAKPVIVTAQFDGGDPLPANTGTRRFLAVTTTGGTATIGDLLFDDGTGVGNMTVLPASDGRAIAVTVALSGGTITFDPDSIYLWDAGTSAYVKIGDIGSVTGASRVIRYVISNAATQDSVSLIPAGARVLLASLEVTTPYSGGATISIGRVGSTSLVQATGDNAPQAANTYAVAQDTAWGGTALVVRTTIGGAPAAGAGVVTVVYANVNS